MAGAATGIAVGIQLRRGGDAGALLGAGGDEAVYLFPVLRIAMHDGRRRIRSQARPALLWTLFFFVAGHLAIGLYLHRRHPEFFDPEVTLRMRKLPARLAEAPGRPLALAVGSSRLVLGLRPQAVMEQIQDDPN